MTEEPTREQIRRITQMMIPKRRRLRMKPPRWAMKDTQREWLFQYCRKDDVATQIRFVRGWYQPWTYAPPPQARQVLVF